MLRNPQSVRRGPLGVALLALVGAALAPSAAGAGLAGLVGLVLLAAVVHRRLAGTWPLVPEVDEWTLRRTPWDQLVRGFEANPRRSPLVVCLTSIPSRIENLQPTLKSLLRQTVRPAQIRLHLPETSRREACAYAIPDWMAEAAVLTRVPCEDHGPATKLLPALDLDPEQPLLVLDDDRIYGPQLVEEMDRAWRENPDAIVCGSGWMAPEDLVDHPTTLLRVLRDAPHVPILGSNIDRPVQVDILQGLQSYVAQPRFFERAELLDYSEAPPEARWCDDVWISGHARAPRLVVPLARLSSPHLGGRRHLRETSLGRNFNAKPDPEARSNSVLLRYFRGRWGAWREAS